MIRYILLTTFLFISSFSYSQIPCVDGSANGFPCKNVDFMALLTPDQLMAEEMDGIFINDLWGWTDVQSGKEYALVGMANGTSFVDVSDPVNPIMLGMLPEHHAAEGAKIKGITHEGGKSVWRDIKVYKDHAFIVAEDEGHGMQVFDLTQLRNVVNPPQIFAETANYQGIGKAHNIVINEETGFAYAVGANSKGDYTCNIGGLHIINIQNPSSPVFAGCFDADGYTHDAQCIIYNGPDPDYQGMEICFNSNEDAVTIVDVTDKSNIKMIATEGYSGSAYTHQGWLTEDQRYFISNDELDEHNHGVTTTSYIWDLSDLDSPEMIGKYVSDLNSIDHNLYIKDAIVYQANYTSGLRILNISDIENANLIEVAFFDTYPAGDFIDFYGAWSNYPFFESGNIIVSDITNGLYILRPTIGTIAKGPDNTEACADDEVFFEVYSNSFNDTFQWQVKNGETYEDLQDNEHYSGTKTRKLTINNATKETEGVNYRVQVIQPHDNLVSSSEASFTLKENPTADFEYAVDGPFYHYTNLSINAQEYEWDFGDNTGIVNIPNPTHKFNGTGLFEVTLTAINECGSDEMSAMHEVITGINEEVLRHVKIYPNPATEKLIIESKGETLQNLGVYSIKGETVISNVNLKEGQNIFDVSFLNKGIFILRLITKEGVANYKLIIE